MIKTIILLLFVCSSNLFPQFDTSWVRTLSGSSNGFDQARCTAIDNAGNIFACGTIVNIGTGTDIIVVKYSPTGDLLWSKTYNGSLNAFDLPNALKIDNFGNVYLTGMASFTDSGGDIVTIKYTSTGDTAWVRRYNGSQNIGDEASSISLDSLGNVYVGGYSTNTGNGSDATLLKYNSSGVLLFAKTINSGLSQVDNCLDINIDNLFNIYMAGYSGSTNGGNDFWVAKLNLNGDTLWTKTFNGSANASDFAKKIRVDNSGNIYAVGYLSNISTDADIFAVKINSSGVLQWSKTYNGPGNDTDEPNDMAVDNDQNVYITGRTTVTGANTDIITMKLAPTGDTSWVRIFGGSSNVNDVGNAILVDSDGYVYSGGGIVNANTDMILLKYNSSGTNEASFTYDRGDYDQINSLCKNNTNEIIAAGVLNLSSIDFAVVKLNQNITGLVQFGHIPTIFTLFQNFPNPFNPVTKIRFDIPNSSNIKLTIYDVLGGEIETLVNQQLNAGSYETEWNASGFSSGVYFCKLSADDYSTIKKMTLLK
ncbi:MAG: SBBP repeat-containing protein [Ignavibacteria bacterium]|nr:SBBP repeat-containing protein [Ignavibacteria bacterium]